MRLGLLLFLIAGCGPARFQTVRTRAHNTPAIEIRQLHLEWSNVFLVRDERAAILVDTGSPGDWAALVDALHASGLAPEQLRAAVLTHAHADHAGLAATLHARGVPILIGHGDVEMAARGRDDPLRATGPLGELLRPFVDFPFHAVVPTQVVDGPVDLGAYGLPDVRVEPMPGHTPGSLVVWIGARDVIVGDEMLGGIGGLILSDVAGEHFYQADRHANYCNVDRLLSVGVERFYVGHGGPFDRASVLGWRRDWLGEAAHCEYEALGR